MGTLRTVAAVAAANFLIQGGVWAVLALLGILGRTCEFSPKGNEVLDDSFTGMAKAYFTATNCWDGGVIFQNLGLMSGSALTTLVCLQFAFNFLLTVTSLILIFVIPKGSSYSFLLWLYILLIFAGAVAVIDLVSASMFTDDKNIISNTANAQAKNLANMLLIVSLVAARGYLFWVLNVLLWLYLFIASSLLLIKAVKRYDKEENRKEGRDNPAFEVDEQGYPVHSAKSRWPWLGVPRWRREYLSQALGSQEARDKAGFGSREQFEPRANGQDGRDRTGLGSREQFERANGQEQSRQPERSRTPNWQGREPPSTNFQRLQDKWEHPNGRGSGQQQRPNGYGRQSPDNRPRPNSLHEAILTIKPLKQVRPKIPEMQARY